jgi:hypothetical protein
MVFSDTNFELVQSSQLRQLAMLFVRSRPGKPMRMVPSESQSENFFAVFDTNYPGKKCIGTIEYYRGDFIIWSRHIKNKKYRENSSDYQRKRTNNIHKALDIMLEYITPYKPTEFLKDAGSECWNNLRQWRDTLSRDTRALFSIPDSVMYQEIKRLMNMGVEFSSQEFRDVANRGVAAYEELARRRNANYKLYYIVFNVRGEATYFESETMPGNTFHMSANASGLAEHTYTVPSEEFLPENIIGEYSLLKMMPVEQVIDGVGKRLSEYEYVIFKSIDNTNTN